MSDKKTGEAFILGMLLCIGLVALGLFISSSITKVKALDRTVTVKGLSEREVPANKATWPIKFSEADNDLSNLSSVIQNKTSLITEFLRKTALMKTRYPYPPLRSLTGRHKDMLIPTRSNSGIQRIPQ